MAEYLEKKNMQNGSASGFHLQILYRSLVPGPYWPNVFLRPKQIQE